VEPTYSSPHHLHPYRGWRKHDKTEGMIMRQKRRREEEKKK
jgi:hypothetical protein